MFVLHDLFGFEYADTLDRSEPAVRQLGSRARRHISERRPRAVIDPQEQARVTAAFMQAAVEGDMASLLSVLAPDVELVTDGGGTVKAALRPIRGADKTARFIAAISAETPGLRWELAGVNGRTGVLVHLGDPLLAVVDVDVVGDRVTAVRVQMNPVKLAGCRPATTGGGGPA